MSVLTVKKIRELIKGLPEDMEIHTPDPGCGCCAEGDVTYPVSSTDIVHEDNNKEKPLVFKLMWNEDG